MRKSFKKMIAGALTGVMALSLSLGLAGNIASADVSKAGKEAAKKEYDPSGTYHAYIGFQQTGNWIFRDEWTHPESGLNGTSLEEGMDGVGLRSDAEYKPLIDSEKTQKLDWNTDVLRSSDYPFKVDGEIHDAEIKGNGTYTVKIDGLNGILNDFKADDTSPDDVKLSMIYVNTDIPLAALDQGLKITNVKLLLDGNEYSGLPADTFYPSEYNDESKLVRFDAVNTYQTNQGAYPDGPTDVAPQPTDSLAIQFDVEGMAQDNPDAVAEEPAAAESSGSDANASGGSAAASDDDTPNGIPGSTVVIVVVILVAVVAVITVVMNLTKRKDE